MNKLSKFKAEFVTHDIVKVELKAYFDVEDYKAFLEVCKPKKSCVQKDAKQ